MSGFHVNQIRVALDRQFRSHIDVSDLATRPAKEKEDGFLTRGLAAFALSICANIAPEVAARHVVDGFDDNGIDAVYYDEIERQLFLVQAKWITSGEGAVKYGEFLKFREGATTLLGGDLSTFNSKLQNHADSITEALGNTSKIVFILAYTGKGKLSKQIQKSVDQWLADLNDPIDIASFEPLDQAKLHTSLSRSVEGTPIDLEVMLSDWGQIREPYQAFYGQIAAAEVAQWYLEHKSRLFTKNLRKLITSSEVNRTLVETIRTTPENFWYFNNGITVLCSSIKKKLLGGPDKSSGIFECRGVSVVNGAQTVGSIAAAYTATPEQARAARVLVRFISLENCPADFAGAVTRATNTQNRIESKDFAALDRQQERLRSELYLSYGVPAVQVDRLGLDNPPAARVEIGA